VCVEGLSIPGLAFAASPSSSLPPSPPSPPTFPTGGKTDPISPSTNLRTFRATAAPFQRNKTSLHSLHPSTHPSFKTPSTDIYSLDATSHPAAAAAAAPAATAPPSPPSPAAAAAAAARHRPIASSHPKGKPLFVVFPHSALPPSLPPCLPPSLPPHVASATSNSSRGLSS